MKTVAADEAITIAIADDHPLLLVGLRQILETVENYRIVVEAENGLSLLDKIETIHVKPDICLLDISMPKLDGYDTLRAIHERWPAIKVIMLSMHYNEFTIIKTFRDGACGCLPKEAKIEEIRTAIFHAQTNGYYHSELAGRTLTSLAKEVAVTGRVSDKELRFLKECCSDLSYTEIAAKLLVSPRTIDSYRDSLFEKLNVRSRTALAIFAMKCGLVSL